MLNASGWPRRLQAAVLVAAVLVAAAALLSMLAANPVLAQAWPSRTITAIIPFAAGNANDIVGRIVLDQASKQVRQTIVIENRPGGGTTIGVTAVARAAPDGYTMLVHSSSFSASYSLHKSLPYDTFKDFAAVVPLGFQPMVLVVAASKPWKTLGDLVAEAKAKPGVLNFASAGHGAASHLAAERFRISAGFQAQHIPFKGPVEALTEVMTGRVDFYFLPIAPALNLIGQGKVRALAVSTSKRAALLPNVPTTAEAGLKGAAYVFWNGLFFPAKTPSEIVNKLHAETTKALAVASVQERLAKIGQEPLPMSPSQFETYFHADVRDTAKLMAAAGGKPG
ncbi:MAG: tripartite tricarboxylate transporter substrate binding protein [Rhizobiales bacterium]|nr:tripartite tricarboxylate transporter substrate binding protein [Hyphomicrobiales bacterium]